MSTPAPDNPTAARDALAVLAVTARCKDEHCVDDETLLAWHEGALSDSEAARVKHQVAHCERCFDLWCELCEALPRPAPAPSFVDRLRAAWDRRPGWPPVVAAAFVVLLGIGLGDRLMQSGPTARVAYELSVQGTSTLRSDADVKDRTLELSPGDRFELLLRPETSTAQSTAVQLFHVRDQARVRLRAPDSATVGEGTLLIRATVGKDIVLPAGEGTLVVLAGTAGELPTIDAALAALADQPKYSGDGWQAWQLSIRVLPRQ